MHFSSIKTTQQIKKLKGTRERKNFSHTANHPACLNISSCLVYFCVYRCFQLQKTGLSPYKQRLHTKVISPHTFSPSNNKPERESASSGLIHLRRWFPPLTVNNICHQIMPHNLPSASARLENKLNASQLCKEKEEKARLLVVSDAEESVKSVCWYAMYVSTFSSICMGLASIYCFQIYLTLL